MRPHQRPLGRVEGRVLVENLVRDGQLADVAQKAGAGEPRKLGGRHRQLAADLDAELSHPPVVAEGLAVLDHVAEGDYSFHPALALPPAAFRYWSPTPS